MHDRRWRAVIFVRPVTAGAEATRYGAFHMAELWYVLNTLYVSDRPFAKADTRIADIVSSYWVNFANTANPDGKGLPYWPSANTRPCSVMELGDRVEVIYSAGSEAEFQFLYRREEQALQPILGS